MELDSSKKLYIKWNNQFIELDYTVGDFDAKDTEINSLQQDIKLYLKTIKEKTAQLDNSQDDRLRLVQKTSKLEFQNKALQERNAGTPPSTTSWRNKALELEEKLKEKNGFAEKLKLESEIKTRYRVGIMDLNKERNDFVESLNSITNGFSVFPNDTNEGRFVAGSFDTNKSVIHIDKIETFYGDTPFEALKKLINAQND